MHQYNAYCEQLSQQLFAVIEQYGDLLTWHKHWDDSGSCQLPVNTHGRFYRGANLFALWNQQWTQGFQSRQWLTLRQVNRLNGRVKKGTQSTRVYFWKFLEEEQEQEDGQTVTVTRPIYREYRVFNREQTTLDALPASDKRPVTVDQLVRQLGVEVVHCGGRACYAPAVDQVFMPEPARFTSGGNYQTTLLHEIVHWTGRPQGLNRSSLAHYHETVEARAEEELVAETGALFLANRLGIDGAIENHAAYVHHWQQWLTPQQVTRAVAHAAQAFHWIIESGI